MLTTTSYMLMISAVVYAVAASLFGWPLWASIPLFITGIGHQTLTGWWLNQQPCPFDTDKPMDPVVEARVYKSYGRIDEARDLLREALTREPERQDLKRELAELGQHHKLSN